MVGYILRQLVLIFAIFAGLLTENHNMIFLSLILIEVLALTKTTHISPDHQYEKRFTYKNNQAHSIMDSFKTREPAM